MAEFDSTLIAGVTVAPPALENPFRAASAIAFVWAVGKSPGIDGTPAMAAASAACWTWSELLQMFPTSITMARMANSAPSPKTNRTSTWPTWRTRLGLAAAAGCDGSGIRRRITGLAPVG